MDDRNGKGTTPLPLSSAGSPVRVWFDDGALEDDAQPVTVEMVSGFSGTRTGQDDVLNGSSIASTPHYLVYATKNGGLRILHRPTTARGMFRGHAGQRVTDVQFYTNSAVFASVGSPAEETAFSNLLVAQVSYDESEARVKTTILLEIRTSHFKILRFKWHHFNMNQLWMIHTGAENTVVATHINTAAIHIDETQGLVEHNLCIVQHPDLSDLREGSAQIKETTSDLTRSTLSNLMDLAWADQERLVVTTHDDGCIILWDWKRVTVRPNGRTGPTALVTIQEHGSVTRCLFLPHLQSVDAVDPQPNSNPNLEEKTPLGKNLTPCFLTATNNNADITLWSPFTSTEGTEPTKLQVFGLERPSRSYNVNVCFGPAPESGVAPSTLLLQSDRSTGKIFAWHLSAEWGISKDDPSQRQVFLRGCDYVVPFQSKYATLSWNVTAEEPASEPLENHGGLIFDVHAAAYQTDAVQYLKFESIKLLPPENTWTDPTPAIRVQRLWHDVHSEHVSEVGSDEGLQYDEEYDVHDDGNDDDDDDDDDDSGFGGAPDASALPVPNGMASPVAGPSGANGGFGNWLGAIAARSTDAPPFTSPVFGTGSSPASAATAATAVRGQTPPMSNRHAHEVSRVQPLSSNPPRAASAPTSASLRLATTTTAAEPPPGLQPPPPSLPTAASVPVLSASPATLKAPPPESVPPTADAAATAGTTATSSPTFSPAVVPSNDGQVISEEIRQTIRDEVAATIVPAVQQALTDSTDASRLQSIETSIADLAKQGVHVDDAKIAASLSQGVEAPLRAAFASNMRDAILPAIESLMGQVLQQASQQLEAQQEASKNAATTNMEAMSSQLTRMTELMTQLTNEVQGLRTELAASQRQQQEVRPPPPPAAAAASPQIAQQQQEEARRAAAKQAAIQNIRHLCNNRQYQQAFELALSSADATVVLFCCANSDLSALLGGQTSVLDDGYLLCLLQQLAQVFRPEMDGDLKVAHSWVHAILVWFSRMSQSRDDVQQSLRRVLTELIAIVNARLHQPPELVQDTRQNLQGLLALARGIQLYLPG